eukprot:scaffold633_cov321-Pavlova_lutheri.AAC.33
MHVYQEFLSLTSLRSTRGEKKLPVSRRPKGTRLLQGRRPVYVVLNVDGEPRNARAFHRRRGPPAGPDSRARKGREGTDHDLEDQGERIEKGRRTNMSKTAD